MIKSFKMFESNEYEDSEGYYFSMIGGNWNMILAKYYDKIVPMNNSSINRITNFVQKNKRLPNVRVNTISFTNRDDRKIKYVVIKDITGGFCSWGRWPSDDWKTPDINRILSFDIVECDDDWFLVKIVGTGYKRGILDRTEVDEPIPHIYKCDQLDGLFKLLKNYGLTYVNKEV